MSRRKEDEAGRRIKGRGAESRTVRISLLIILFCFCVGFAQASIISRNPLLAAVQLRVCIVSNCYGIPVSQLAGYESLPDSGTGSGPQRSVEGWVVFVTGIYEELQVPIQPFANAACFASKGLVLFIQKSLARHVPACLLYAYSHHSLFCNAS